MNQAGQVCAPLFMKKGEGSSEISRKDEIWESITDLITIAGGKLTGYRKMAENVVNRIAYLLSKEGYKGFTTCQTRNIPISGGHFGGSHMLSSFMENNRKRHWRRDLRVSNMKNL